jgi:alkylated DNA repair dioxygenase AlkB
MDAPITYLPGFVPFPDNAFASLRDDLAWERREDAPRCEYYVNEDPTKDYLYGQGRGRRRYSPRPWHLVIRSIQDALQALSGCKFEVCFLNRYLNQSDQLGWHADNSPEMDDARPIGIVSFGVERDILFRPLNDTTKLEKLRLGHGSLCLMAPGMQDAWQHRIPKASFTCGERISLTFRGYVAVQEEG